MNEDIIINNNNDIIKVFIKLEFSETKIQNLYEINKSRKIITIYDTENNPYHFEFDKIFNNIDTNSYIFEEICLNCITQNFEGISFSFISYGETNSNKFNLLFGKILEENDQININNHGLFIRYLNDLMKKNIMYNYDIRLSLMLIYEDKLIDLFDLFNLDNKNNNNYDLNFFVHKGIKIGKNKKIIEQIKKIEYDGDINKIIDLLYVIINTLIKLENKSNNFIYTLSHLCCVVYLIDKNNNNKVISNTSFILLNGSEHLYNANKLKLSKQEDNNISNTVKNSLNMQITYDGIINCIKNNKYVTKSINKNEINDSSKEVLDEEISKNSKLIAVLNDICFSKNIKNIKFRIIGNIIPIKEYFKTTRDTLLFCSKIYKILNKLNPKLNIDNESLLNSGKKEIDLNYQLKLYLKQISSLNLMIEKKDSKINFLSQHYNAQIKALKKFFDFKGDLNAIIAGEMNYEEENFTKNLKNMNIKINEQESKIKEYKALLEKKENELKKLKNIEDIKITDETMINYYLSVRNSKMEKERENKIINDLNKKIEELDKIIVNKDKIIKILNNDLTEKKNIIFNLNKIINMNIRKEGEKNNKNKFKKSKINDEELNDKYKNIIREAKKEVYLIQKKLDNAEELYKSKIELFYNEFFRLYEIVLQSIKDYQKVFEGDNFDKKKKIEFDKIILSIEKDYKELKNKNEIKQSFIESLAKENANKITKSINAQQIEEKDQEIKNNLPMSEKESTIQKLNEKLISMSHYLKVQLNKNATNNKMLNSQKITLEKIQKNNLIHNHLVKNKKNDKLMPNSHYNSPTSNLRANRIIKNLNLTDKIETININNKSSINNDFILISDNSAISDKNKNIKIKHKNNAKYMKKIFIKKYQNQNDIKEKRPFSVDNKIVIN